LYSASHYKLKIFSNALGTQHHLKQRRGIWSILSSPIHPWVGLGCVNKFEPLHVHPGTICLYLFVLCVQTFLVMKDSCYCCCLSNSNVNTSGRIQRKRLVNSHLAGI